MKKNDLIAYLQAIKGNPEVVFFNSFVDDWQYISKPTVGSLQKFTYTASIRQILDMERAQNGRAKMTDDEYTTWKKASDSNAEYRKPTSRDIGTSSFRKVSNKKVIFLEAIPRGKTYSDRLGVLRY